MVIDVHAHIVPRGLREMRASGGQGSGSWYGVEVKQAPGGKVEHTVGNHRKLPTYKTGLTLEDRVRDMDAAGVDLQLLSMSPSFVQYRAEPAVAAAGAREVNDELAEIAAQHPQRFGGLAHLPLQDTDAAVTELERAVRDLGLAGAAVHTHVNGTNWDSSDLFPVLAAAEQLGAMVFFHPAQVRVRDAAPDYHLRNTVGNPWETTVAVGSLIFGGTLDRLPDLKACFAHGGGYAAFAAGRFDHAWGVREDAKGARGLPSDYLRRLSFDCVTHSPAALSYLVETVGAGSVVLGTDYPADMALGDPVGFVGGNPTLTDADKQAILHGNAERLLGLADGTAARA